MTNITKDVHHKTCILKKRKQAIKHRTRVKMLFIIKTKLNNGQDMDSVQLQQTII